MNPPFHPDSSLVLVVDDDRTLRSLLRFAMEEEGYRVAEAKNGENCLAELTRLQPDLVLLDAVMPVMDGFTCCSQLRALPATKHTPVLMITVLDDQESVDRAFAVGATDYVTKPIHWAVLRQRVARLLEASRSHKQIQKVVDTLQKQTQRELLFRGIAQRLTQSLMLEDILNPSVREMREFLQVEQVAVYHRNGNLAVRSIAKSEASSIASSAKTSNWQMAYTKEFELGQAVAISDSQGEGVPAAVVECLVKLNIKAALIVPILIRGEWWGLLEATHSESGDWETDMVEWLVDIANLVAIAIGYPR
jgi:CheY-like chemotaxis protein